MVVARRAFGELGGRLPALLNYVSTLGWYTVNTILAAFGAQLLIGGLLFWQAALVLVVLQAILGIYGHDLVHRFERAMSIVLGMLFVVLSVYGLARGGRLVSYHGTVHAIWPPFAIVVAATLSYLGSWSPYGADYSRYLPPETPRRTTWAWAFLGGERLRELPAPARLLVHAVAGRSSPRLLHPFPPLYTGPIAAHMGGADLSFYVGFWVAALAYYAATRSSLRSELPPPTEEEQLRART